MCGFCAVITGIPHWTDVASDAGDRVEEFDSHAWRVARQRRIRLINAVLVHYGCRVDDWMGEQFIVSSTRGRREIVGRLPEVWRIAEDIAQSPIDPLDPQLLHTLSTPACES